MKRERSGSNKVTRVLFIELGSNQEKMLDVIKYGKEKYNLNEMMFSDYINQRQNKDVAELDNITLFMMIDSYQNVMGGDYVEQWFMSREINEWSQIKLKNNQVDFPLRFKCIPVTDDQWIGVIDTDTLLDLKNANLINYNPNTQRTLKHAVVKDHVLYYAHTNNNAVAKIKKSFMDNSYIPNTITLNIPETEEDFYYDKESCELIIKSLSAFDINDGYHRYIAITQAKMENEDFNYPMELRIQHFPEAKAQQFIYQEDQKTKMKKMDSESFNLKSPENQVTIKLNADPLCNIHGFISRNDGKINFGLFSHIVKLLYFPVKNRNVDIQEILRVKNELRSDWNLLTEQDPSFLNKKYTTKLLLAVMATFYCYRDKDKEGLVEAIYKTIPICENIIRDKITHQKTRKILQMIEEGVENNV